MYFDVSRRDLSIATGFRSIRATVANLWSILGQNGGLPLAPGSGCWCLLLGCTSGGARSPLRVTNAKSGPRNYYTFATVARIYLKIVAIERSRRDTSKYIPKLINLARQKTISEEIMIFCGKFFQIFRIFSKNLEIFEIFQKIRKISKSWKNFQVLKNVGKSYRLKNEKYFHHCLGFWN